MQIISKFCAIFFEHCILQHISNQTAHTNTNCAKCHDLVGLDNQ